MPKSRFPMPTSMELVLTGLMRLARFFLVNGLSIPASSYLMARTAERIGLTKLSAKLYSITLSCAETSSSSKVFKARQLWEFHREQIRFKLGLPHAVDPFFEALARPAVEGMATARDRRRAPGYFEAHFSDRGLTIDGFLRKDLSKAHIEVMLDDHVIRSLTPAIAPFGIPIFVLHVSRDALEKFPARTRLSIRVAPADMLLSNGSNHIELLIPHMRASAIAQDVHIALDKKGFLIREGAEITQLQSGFFEIYHRASEVFSSSLGHDLFLMYGTLLGQRRLGNILPGDDDFDVGYYSNATSSSQVRTEGMHIIVKLVSAGFAVSINRGGRLFRLSLPGMQLACHLDVHAVWREKGSLWIHPRANLSLSRDAFSPTQAATLGGHDVLIPGLADEFLRAYYGDNWKQPDPAYSTAARRFPRWKEKHLQKSCISPKQFRQMKRSLHDISKFHSNGGSLTAIGLESIYPSITSRHDHS